MSEPQRRTVYLVRKIGWTFNGEWHYPLTDDQGPLSWPVRAFTTRAKAEEYRRDRERQAREWWESPLSCGVALTDLTDRSDEELQAVLLECGLSAPPGPISFDALARRWHTLAPRLS